MLDLMHIILRQEMWLVTRDGKLTCLPLQLPPMVTLVPIYGYSVGRKNENFPRRNCKVSAFVPRCDRILKPFMLSLF
uniref:Uncharacterized protein n=1 Tax=Tetranychus urticae TaxID=32264 RepID=T1KLZ8_TETUR